MKSFKEWKPPAIQQDNQTEGNELAFWSRMPKSVGKSKRLS
jgi:hypothetical protein